VGLIARLLLTPSPRKLGCPHAACIVAGLAVSPC
jgi:hypothetical protein